MIFVSLHAGPSASGAKIICATDDRKIIASVARAGLKKLKKFPDPNPVLAHLSAGSRGALEEVIREVETPEQRVRR